MALMERTYLRTQLNNFWHILVGTQLRREVKQAVQRQLPPLTGRQPALPGLPNSFVGGIQIEAVDPNTMMMAAQQTPAPNGAPAAPVVRPSMTIQRVAPLVPAAQAPKSGGRLGRLFGIYGGLTLASAAAALVIPATNLAIHIPGMAMYFITHGLGAAIGISAAVNALPFLLIGTVHIIKNAVQASRARKTAEAAAVQAAAQAANQPKPAAELTNIATEVNAICQHVYGEDAAGLKTAYKDLAKLRNFQSVLETSHDPIFDQAKQAAGDHIIALNRLIVGTSGKLGLVCEYTNSSGAKCTYLLEPAKTSDPDKKFANSQSLGEGGMGEVYKGRHFPPTGEFVALKIIKKAESDGDKALRADERVKLEAFLINVRHENIVRYLDSGEMADGTKVLVMEFLDGESLGARLKRERVLAPDVAIDIISQAAAGLGAAHNYVLVNPNNPAESKPYPIAHRDIKPENIFLPKEQPAKMLDFGMAKMPTNEELTEYTSAGNLVGTPKFFSPEYAVFSLIQKSENISGIDKGRWFIRQDVFSIAAVLYFSLVGERPYGMDANPYFLTSTAAAVEAFNKGALNLDQYISQMMVASQNFLRPLEQRNISPELFAVIGKALALDPRARYQTIDEFRADLEKARQSLTAGVSTPDSLPYDKTVHSVSGLPGEPAPISAKTTQARPGAAQPTESLSSIDVESLDFGSMAADVPATLDQIRAELNDAGKRMALISQIALGNYEPAFALNPQEKRRLIAQLMQVSADLTDPTEIDLADTAIDMLRSA